MPRTGRLVVPGYPHHIVQRGHNRQLVFVEHSDYQNYLASLRELAEQFGIKVFSYCLMTNHVHLLVSPDTAAGLGAFMKGLAARATRYRNKLEGRSGTLWEGRYKSSVVDTDEYLLACSRYIELNPVRARMVVNAGDYEWSSFNQRAGVDPQWLADDPCFESLALGITEAEGRTKYRDFVESGIPDQEYELIRQAVQRNQLTGSGRFVDEIEATLGLRVERRGPGRPKIDK
ncbi:MAG TPA: transposase [Pseudomonas xinjiangensis]|uniref:Transposase n=2 Tax=root TaxID=1 RepID=A0A7V1FR09_9GAMM|nr:transposase [Halopseudomonas xinjiangensis]HEC47791.1 transposase [Halopseudomonas xinjiangensis]